MPASALENTDSISHESLSIENGVPDAPNSENGELPSFPLLHNSVSNDTGPVSTGVAIQKRVADDDNDDEPAEVKPFLRTSSPDSGARNGSSALDADEDDNTPPPDQNGELRTESLGVHLHTRADTDPSSRDQRHLRLSPDRAPPPPHRDL